MRYKFTKMHGLGNDFVVLDGVSQNIKINADKIRRIADRHFGVGCEQVLIVQPPTSPNADFRYVIFNRDGSEVENCGNGARCFALFVRQAGLTMKNHLRVETAGGKLVLHVHDDKNVTVDMGVPKLAPEDIPFEAAERSLTYPITANSQCFDITVVSMGNPHAVTLVEDVDHFAVEHVGSLIEKHERFPQNVNAGFLQVLSRGEAKLRVFERGVGETLACGSGACAALVTGVLRDILDGEVDMHLPGGTLRLSWEGEGTPVMMTGPATNVFLGQIKL